MEVKKYEIWIEGYSATEEHEDAYRLIDRENHIKLWEGCTFQQACVKALNKLKWPMLYEAIQGLGSCYYDPNNNSYWGRRFFDNETDARKSFG